MPWEDGEFDGVTFHRSLFEFLECFLNFRAVVSFRFILAHLDATALYEDGIFYAWTKSSFSVLVSVRSDVK